MECLIPGRFVLPPQHGTVRAVVLVDIQCGYKSRKSGEPRVKFLGTTMNLFMRCLGVKSDLNGIHGLSAPSHSLREAQFHARYSAKRYPILSCLRLTSTPNSFPRRELTPTVRREIWVPNNQQDSFASGKPYPGNSHSGVPPISAFCCGGGSPFSQPAQSSRGGGGGGLSRGRPASLSGGRTPFAYDAGHDHTMDRAGAVKCATWKRASGIICGRRSSSGFCPVRIRPLVCGRVKTVGASAIGPFHSRARRGGVAHTQKSGGLRPICKKVAFWLLMVWTV